MSQQLMTGEADRRVRLIADELCRRGVPGYWYAQVRRVALGNGSDDDIAITRGVLRVAKPRDQRPDIDVLAYTSIARLRPEWRGRAIAVLRERAARRSAS